MRRIVTVFVVAAGVGLLVGGPAAADTAPPECTGICQTTYRARSAEAHFTTVGAGGFEPGAIVSDTFVFASTGSWRSDGSRIRGVTVNVFVTRYTETEDGDVRWISDRSGTATGSAVRFSVAPRLAGATLTAMILLTTCVPSGVEDVVCTADDEPTTVEMDWTATGRAVYSSFRGHFRTSGQNIIDRFQGTSRAATAIGQIGSTTLTGLVDAAVSNVQSRTLSVNHLPG